MKIQLKCTGNSCNSPCYTYNSKFLKECPKCQGKLNQNMKMVNIKEGNMIIRMSVTWNIWLIMKDNICTGFRFNDKIGKEDVDVDALIQYLDKADNEKIDHYTGEKRIEEFDLPYHYMMIEGEILIFHMDFV